MCQKASTRKELQNELPCTARLGNHARRYLRQTAHHELGTDRSPLCSLCAWRPVPVRCCRTFWPVGQNVRSEALYEFPGIRGRSALVHAQGCRSVPCVGGHGLRNIIRNPADPGIVAAIDFAGQRHSARLVWNGDGDLFRTEVSDGLFGLLRVWGRRSAGAACLQAEPQHDFAIAYSGDNIHEAKVETYRNHRGLVYRNSECREVVCSETE